MYKIYSLRLSKVVTGVRIYLLGAAGGSVDVEVIRFYLDTFWIQRSVRHPSSKLLDISFRIQIVVLRVDPYGPGCDYF